MIRRITDAASAVLIIAGALCAVLLLAAGIRVALAQNNWQTPSTAFMSGMVSGFLNASGVAVPVTPTAPLPVNPDAYPSGATAITAASGTVAAGTATATLAATSGKTTYLCGFAITSTGSTSAAVVAPTVTNVVTGTMTFAYATVAGVTATNAVLVVPFAPCIPASATNTTIPVALPSLGSGSTNATVNAWGYQQ